MAVREIVDESGFRWRVWDITPEQAHPITRFEDYLQGYLQGWLVFEREDGSERRRLHPVPSGWAEMRDTELLDLLARAERPPARGSRAAVPKTGAMPARPRSRSRPVRIRSFLYPGGRLWTVAEMQVQYEDPTGELMGEPRTVLRFSAGRRSLDLLAWPPDWSEYSDQELADLLLRAFPRVPVERAPGTPARRRTDVQPPEREQGT